MFLTMEQRALSMSCHTTTDSLNMHTSPGVTLGCADCHGGKAEVFVAPGVQPGSQGDSRSKVRATS